MTDALHPIHPIPLDKLPASLRERIQSGLPFKIHIDERLTFLGYCLWMDIYCGYTNFVNQKIAGGLTPDQQRIYDRERAYWLQQKAKNPPAHTTLDELYDQVLPLGAPNTSATWDTLRLIFGSDQVDKIRGDK